MTTGETVKRIVKVLPWTLAGAYIIFAVAMILKDEEKAIDLLMAATFPVGIGIYRISRFIAQMFLLGGSRMEEMAPSGQEILDMSYYIFYFNFIVVGALLYFLMGFGLRWLIARFSCGGDASKRGVEAKTQEDGAKDLS